MTPKYCDDCRSFNCDGQHNPGAECGGMGRGDQGQGAGVAAMTLPILNLALIVADLAVCAAWLIIWAT